MKVPFLDLKAQYLSMKDEIHAAIQEVLDATAFAGGPFVARFEKEFAAFCGCQEGIGVGSGTEALWLCLLALGIGPGDEVITVPNSFIATAEAISFCGASPAFVDVDPSTYTLDPNKLEEYLKFRNPNSAIRNRRSQESRVRSQDATSSGRRSAVSGQQSGGRGQNPATRNPKPETRNASSIRNPQSAFRNGTPKAVIPVHLFGQPADMDPILEIAKKYNLAVIEDACQAHGALYKEKKAGSLGDAGCFSFYPGKNLGAYGEAGAVVTNNPVMAAKMRMVRDHGQSKKYHHDLIGWNDRMDGIQGAILSAKLKHLSAWNEARRKNALLYTKLLKNTGGIVVPEEAPYARHIYHIYAVRVQNRDKLMSALGEKGISCGIHYPIPIHLTDAYKFMGLGKGSFPAAEKCANEFLSLPMFPELAEEQIEYVCSEIKILLS
ncbi:MAG: DegT/DnrJ/EryC1/StrS family aminotransferase [Deltaproteobacteria bacterium]|nr:DegT/DnrJ/EryC1/StrS family aminotransferase [Deltaproteobacteria bacterium]